MFTNPSKTDHYCQNEFFRSSFINTSPFSPVAGNVVFSQHVLQNSSKVWQLVASLEGFLRLRPRYTQERPMGWHDTTLRTRL
ncbi:hypothetical protein A6X21_07115 [Planctopirus hydrillae]|uniref:Uncharacterized protein n=1 Tax=Planctopirus hydrillae TaxID=1841610 RepID=A0A1C3EA56_9PLAN|nr:hypothetical protein A6X21_07115 [Planctopirus hydrillae]